MIGTGNKKWRRSVRSKRHWGLGELGKNKVTKGTTRNGQKTRGKGQGILRWSTIDMNGFLSFVDPEILCHNALYLSLSYGLGISQVVISVFDTT